MVAKQTEKEKTGLIVKLIKPFSDNFEVLYAKNHPDCYHILIGGIIMDYLYSKEEVADEIHFSLNFGYEISYGDVSEFGMFVSRPYPQQ